MINRYCTVEMRRIWEDEERYRLWLEIESRAVDSMVYRGIIPEEVRSIRDIRIDQEFMNDMLLIEQCVKHDVVAFLDCVRKRMGEWGKFIHYGLTSSDLVDTALSTQILMSGHLIKENLYDLKDVLERKANKYRHTPMVGRTHGMHAEPITFGLKILNWYDSIWRGIKWINNALDDLQVGKISGSVGNYAHIPPEVEEDVLGVFNLRADPISNQIIQRDRHANLFCSLAIVAGTLERIATDLRHMQMTEIGEVEEPTGNHQQGSSSMPHKRNPVTLENICGLARIVRANASASLENIPLWGERDITHSSVERIIAPDTMCIIQHMIIHITEVIKGMVVNEDRMRKNLNRMGDLLYSQQNKLDDISGFDNSYDLPEDKLYNHLKYTDYIFNRVLGK